MKTMMFLLVSAVALLVSPSPARHKPDENLNHIIDVAKEYNETLNKEFFVEDLAPLTNECEDKFYCKVHDVLHKHEHFGKRKKEQELVRNLKIFVDSISTNCTVLLQEVTPTGVQVPIPKLVNYLTSCIQKRNLRGSKKSND